jgi:VIT1/CCC1 family predicted Fe2+/Mn2+ transporter
METQMERQEDRREGIGQVKIASGLNVLLGLWLLVAPFLLGYAEVGAAMWNDVIVGGLVLALAGIRVWKPAQNRWLSWTNLLLGVWLLAAPFILTYSGVAAAMWNDVIVGIGIAVLGAWSAVATPETA